MVYTVAPLEYTSDIPEAANTSRNWPVVMVLELARVSREITTVFVRRSSDPADAMRPLDRWMDGAVMREVTVNADSDSVSTVSPDAESVDALKSPVSDRFEKTVVPVER